MGNAPDVRVRLSAEGVDEVVRALAAVQKAAQDTGKAASGVNQLSDAFAKLGLNLRSLTVGGAVAGLGLMVKSTLENIEAMDRLSQKTGISAGTLSVFAMEAKQVGVSQEAVEKGLVRFTRAMGELDAGAPKTAAAIRNLFGSSNALNGLSPEQRLLKVVDAMGKIEDPGKRAKAAFDLLGKGGADLIPVLNRLAAEGFDKVKLRAQQMGVYLDTETVKSARAAADAMRTLEIQGQGVATQFTAGIAPSIANALGGITKATEGPVNGFKAIGEAVGWVAKAITTGFVTAGKVVAFVINRIDLELDEIIARAKNAYTSLADAAKGGGLSRLIQGGNDDQALKAQFGQKAKELGEAFKEDLGQALEGIWDKNAVPEGIGNKDHDEQAEAARIAGAQALAKARLDAIKSRLDNELKIYTEHNKLLEEQAKALYERALSSLDEYYQARASLQARLLDKEIATLQAKKDAIAKSGIQTTNKDTDATIEAKRIELKKELDALDAQIAEKEIQRKEKVLSLSEDERKKREELGQKTLEIEAKIAAAEGKRHDSAMDNIEKEAAAYRKAGVDEDLISRFVASSSQSAGVANSIKDIGNQIAALEDVKKVLDARVQSGEIFPTQALLAFGSAAEKTVPQILKLIEAQKALATPDQVKELDKMKETLLGIQANSQRAIDPTTKLKSEFEQAATQDLTNFFSKGIDSAHNFGDAMRGLALSVVDSLKQIAAQMIANILIQQAMKAATGFFSGGGSVGAPGHAAGGWIDGPGSSTSDSIPSRLSKGEFVVKASAAARNRGLLELINRGTEVPVLRAPGSPVIQGVAGGYAAQAVGSHTLNGTLEVGVGDGLVARVVKHLESDRGFGKVLVKQASQNQKAMATALGTNR